MKRENHTMTDEELVADGVTTMKDEDGSEYPTKDGKTVYLGSLGISAKVIPAVLGGFNLFMFGELPDPSQPANEFIRKSMNRINRLGYTALIDEVLKDEDIGRALFELKIHPDKYNVFIYTAVVAALIAENYGGANSIAVKMDYRILREKEAGVGRHSGPSISAAVLNMGDIPEALKDILGIKEGQPEKPPVH